MGDGDDDDGDDNDEKKIPGHPGPIPNAPRDNISRKGIPSLRYAEHFEGTKKIAIWDLGDMG